MKVAIRLGIFTFSFIVLACSHVGHVRKVASNQDPTKFVVQSTFSQTSEDKGDACLEITGALLNSQRDSFTILSRERRKRPIDISIVSETEEFAFHIMEAKNSVPQRVIEESRLQTRELLKRLTIIRFDNEFFPSEANQLNHMVNRRQSLEPQLEPIVRMPGFENFHLKFSKEAPDGTVRLVSGQMPFEFGRTGKVSQKKRFKLPWQMHDNLKKFASTTRVAQNDIYTWEMGRTAVSSEDKSSNQQKLKIVAYLAYRELQLMDGDIDKAFIYVHVAEEKVMQLCRRLYKWDPLEDSEKLLPKGEYIFELPLKKLLEDYDLLAEVPIIKKLEELTGLRSSTDIFEVWDAMNRAFYHYLEMSDTQIAIDDRFVLGRSQLEQTLNKFNLTFEDVESLIPMYQHRFPVPFEYYEWKPPRGMLPIFINVDDKALDKDFLASLYEYYTFELEERGQDLKVYLDNIYLIFNVQVGSAQKMKEEMGMDVFLPSFHQEHQLLYLNARQWEDFYLNNSGKQGTIKRGQENYNYLKEELLIPF